MKMGLDGEALSLIDKVEAVWSQTIHTLGSAIPKQLRHATADVLARAMRKTGAASEMFGESQSRLEPQFEGTLLNAHFQ